MEQKFTFNVAEEAIGQRLDRFLANAVEGFSRTHLQQLIADGFVQVAGKQVKPNYRLEADDQVTMSVPSPVAPSSLAVEAIPLQVLYEDEQLLVINKCRGMVVHPAAGHRSGTLVNALLAHCGELAAVGGVARPGIVHRLDKNTSGVMMVAKTDLAHQKLAQQIKDRTAKRTYLAVVKGNISEDRGIINAPIGRHPQHRKKMAVVKEGGREAVTHFTVRERYGSYTLVECQLQTGRTHQIRVHFSYIGFPVFGDTEYGVSDKTLPPITGQCLHSCRLSFLHPVTAQPMQFEAPLPEDMDQIVQHLRRGSKKSG